MKDPPGLSYAVLDAWLRAMDDEPSSAAGIVQSTASVGVGVDNGLIVVVATTLPSALPGRIGGRNVERSGGDLRVDTVGLRRGTRGGVRCSGDLDGVSVLAGTWREDRATAFAAFLLLRSSIRGGTRRPA
eukprot:COSAG02_NODE_15985_length_1123_cov_1.011719_1_plen_130_part_00